MSLRFNPFTGTFDFTKCDSTSNVITNTGLGFYTTFIAGKMSDMDEGYDNFIDACSLPITSTRQIIDLGTLDELCN